MCPFLPYIHHGKGYLVRGQKDLTLFTWEKSHLCVFFCKSKMAVGGEGSEELFLHYTEKNSYWWNHFVKLAIIKLNIHIPDDSGIPLPELTLK